MTRKKLLECNQVQDPALERHDRRKKKQKREPIWSTQGYRKQNFLNSQFLCTASTKIKNAHPTVTYARRQASLELCA